MNHRFGEIVAASDAYQIQLDSKSLRTLSPWLAEDSLGITPVSYPAFLDHHDHGVFHRVKHIHQTLCIAL